MANAAKKVSERQRVKNINERLVEQEQQTQAIIASVNSGFSQVGSNLQMLSERLDAIVEILGEDEVAAVIQEKRERAAKEALEASEKALKEQLELGAIMESEKVDEDSLIVGIERDPDGEPIPPGKIQVAFKSVLPEFQEQLLGSEVGFQFETKDGSTFEVVGIYNENPDFEAAADPSDEAEMTEDLEDEAVNE